MKKFGRPALLLALSFGLVELAQAQSSSGSTNLNEVRPDQINTITTAVPFLMITPDSRAGGMGDVGGATSTDVNSIHWNPSKLGFAEKKLAVGVSYTPWLRALVPDINLAYLSGYYKTKKSGTIAASLRYFSLGDITFTDNNGNTIGQFRPNEFAIDLAYGTKLGKNFAAGGAVRFVNSNLTGGTPVEGSATHPGRSIAVDISALYRKEKIKLGDKKAIGAIGLNISNIGSKMSYSDRDGKDNADFIPINMRLGGSLTVQLDDYNSIALAADINKLLVPTPPVYKHNIVTDTNGVEVDQGIDYDANGDPVILAGKDPNRGVAEGIFGSFNDAPNGGKEELREINYSVGLEYWYNQLFAIRLGYFYEHPTKGNRQFFTIGAGVKYNVFGLDFAYLIPTQQRNPLENTLRFSLTFDFDAFKAQNEETKTE
ncbi:MAG: type IX secretion system outer membrane channel protein PorV [Bacteroidota bacterium]|nr:type IX secretion system outer membrane channel protein PorV [Bacteroidota bacterium]